MGADTCGRAGEQYAAEWLEHEGYRVIDRNVHSRYGEVDLIAVKGGTICFVEVKTRRQGAMVSGQLAVSTAKQRRIISTALLYLQEHPAQNRQPRFDLITVETDARGTILSHEHLEGAYDGQAYTG